LVQQALDIVVAWHAALNAPDLDALLALSSTDVEVGGPRGSGRGADLLRDWVARAGIHMQPARLFARAGSVVVEETARWRDENGQLTAPQPAACTFAVSDGQVVSVFRYPDLASALAAAGLDESDNVP
jgi:hypothetical protein